MGGLLTLSCLLWIGVGLGSTLRAPLTKPNFVVFFVDDLGYGDPTFNGHPTTSTPNLDRLAHGGKILTTWYSAYPVCTASRTSMLTGRYTARTGMPGVIGPIAAGGLPDSERTYAEYLKGAGYSTCAIGKWHLGQRPEYLPGNRGFDRYLGIPYSDDMGEAYQSWCNGTHSPIPPGGKSTPPLPLVQQIDNHTVVRQQPIDLTNLAQKYADFAHSFISDNKDKPFLLYYPFSHVHTTHNSKPDKQYSQCKLQNSTRRGRFGDALKEVDWQVGLVMEQLESLGLDKNTLVLFSSDNGPWLVQGLGSGSEGIMTGRASGYWNTGKGSTWEGGVREPAFAYWPGQITPATRSSEIVSTMDVLPTLLHFAGIPQPTDRTIDGRDMSDIILHDGVSKHQYLWYYNGGKAYKKNDTCTGYMCPHAVRIGKYKAHFKTAPGLGGCAGCTPKEYNPPLFFNLDEDPSEAFPLKEEDMQELTAQIMAAKAAWDKGFTYGHIKEGSDPQYGVCCDWAKKCSCPNGTTPYNLGVPVPMDPLAGFDPQYIEHGDHVSN